MIKYKKCKLCDKEIKTHTISAGKVDGCHRRLTDSDEAVLYGKNVWFCYNCWNQLIEEINKWKKQE
jgi:hypothetical protein